MRQLLLIATISLSMATWALAQELQGVGQHEQAQQTTNAKDDYDFFSYPSQTQQTKTAKVLTGSNMGEQANSPSAQPPSMGVNMGSQNGDAYNGKMYRLNGSWQDLNGVPPHDIGLGGTPALPEPSTSNMGEEPSSQNAQPASMGANMGLQNRIEYNGKMYRLNDSWQGVPAGDIGLGGTPALPEPLASSTSSSVTPPASQR